MARQYIFLSDVFGSIATFRLKLFKALDHLAGQTIAFLLPPQAPKGFPGDIKKILVIRPGGIGDAVFLLPILKALKERGFIMDMLCERRNAGIFISQAHLFNKVYLYDRQPLAVFAASYDVAVDTEQWHYLSALTAYFVRASYKTGFAARPGRAKLFHRAAPYGANDYELDNFARLFEGLLPDGLNPQRLGVEGSFQITTSAKAWAKEEIQGNFITLFLGGSIALRRLNEGQVLGIARDILAKNYAIALLGGGDVEHFAQKMSVEINSPKVFNYAGRLTLMQSAALIQQSRKFIGPDSGLMHLACAVGTPVVAVFGPGNLAKWGPRGHQHRVVTLNVSCAPCTRFGYTLPTCRGSYHCVKNINIWKITEPISESL